MITKTSSGKWQVRVFYQGKEYGSKTITLKADAIQYERDEVRKLQLGTWVDPKVGKMPLSQAIDLFNAERKGVIPQKTWDTVESNLRNHVPPELGKRPIRSIRTSDYDVLFADLIRGGLKASTVRRIRDCLSTFYTWAVKNAYVAENAIKNADVPKGDGTDDETILPFLPAELAELIRRQREIHPLADATEFLALTGIRWGELVALKVSAYAEHPKPMITVSRSQSDSYEEKTTKSRRIRKVPLTTRANEIIRPWLVGKNAGDRVFTAARGGKLWGRNFARAVHWAELSPDRSPHQLRHTAATNWLRANVDIKTVAAWLGHSSSAFTLSRYAHYMNEDSDTAAMLRVEAFHREHEAGGTTVTDMKKAGSSA